MGLLSLFREMMDVRFGSLWTNIPRSRFEELGVDYGQRVEVTIQDDTRTVYRNFLTYAHSFSDVFVGEPLVYANSLDCMAAAINQGSFAKAYGIGTGDQLEDRAAQGAAPCVRVGERSARREGLRRPRHVCRGR